MAVVTACQAWRAPTRCTMCHRRRARLHPPARAIALLPGLDRAHVLLSEPQARGFLLEQSFSAGGASSLVFNRRRSMRAPRADRKKARR